MFKSTTLNRLRTIGIAAACAAIVGASAISSRAQNTYNNSSASQVDLAPGTVIPVILNNELTSNGSTNGQTFTASVDNSRQAYNSLMQGATVDGIVREAVPQSGKDPGTLQLSFTALHLQNGQTYPISGTATSLDNSFVTTGSDGVMSAKPQVKDQSLKYAGIGAGAGALLSVLSNGKLNLGTALIGGLLGYGAGAIDKNQQEQKVHDVDLQPGTTMGVLLNNRLHYYRHSQFNSTTNVVTPAPINTGVKYYWYNGQKWMFDPATGTRAIVSDPTLQQPQQFQHVVRYKYYTYQGHPFRMNLDTGERMQMD